MKNLNGLLLIYTYFSLIPMYLHLNQKEGQYFIKYLWKNYNSNLAYCIYFITVPTHVYLLELQYLLTPADCYLMG